MVGKTVLNNTYVEWQLKSI